jgi:hypothetical protein
MSAESERFFLFIGTNWYGDAAADKVRAAGITVRRKVLYSRPGNWETILPILADPMIMGAVVKLTPSIYLRIAAPGYRESAQQLFRALAAVPHVVFVHQSILAGIDTRLPDIFDELDDDEDDEYREQWRSQLFRLPPGAVRATVDSLLEEYGINVIPYETNAEMSVLATAFIDDNENNLLFRVYVPSGRLYAAEADKLLSLFRDWLSGVGKHGVRQDGYKTAAGQVYEFFGDESLQRTEISREFDVFSKFLTTCVEDPAAATVTLSGAGLNRGAAESVVARYGKEVRRLQLDIRQERETRLLSIRHGLEAELLDAGTEVSFPWAEVDEMVHSLVPGVRDLRPMRLLTLSPGGPTTPVTLNISQNIVNAVQSTVVQSIQGTSNLGASAKEMLDLVSRFGGVEKVALESAIYELEDSDARSADRLGARQKLKAFLFQLGGKVEDAALHVLQTYLETKMLGR